MKLLCLICLLWLLAACNHQADTSQQLQAQTYSLRSKIENSYKPGFGEFMNSIQVHHAKPWLAGINNNWKLADFEILDIQELLEDIQKYHPGRSETKAIGMINPVLSV